MNAPFTSRAVALIRSDLNGKAYPVSTYNGSTVVLCKLPGMPPFFLVDSAGDLPPIAKRLQQAGAIVIDIADLEHLPA